MKKLTDWFDSVFVIHCAYRKDRLRALTKNIEDTGVADISRITLYPAVQGKLTEPPKYWKLGHAAWGCLQSHRRVIEDVLHTHLYKKAPANVLVLEDDVHFLPESLETINSFMGDVPEDWGQIYFGGQHTGPVSSTNSPKVYQPTSVNRAHAYALNRHVFKDFYAKLHDVDKLKENPLWLNDNLIEDAHREKKWTIYCPPQWVCGQSAGHSDISLEVDPLRMWDDKPDKLFPNKGVPVTLLK